MIRDCFKGAPQMLKIIGSTGLALVLLTGVAVAGDDWVPSGFEGFYAGVYTGYAKGTVGDSGSPASYPNVSLDGAFVGGQAGYNFVLRNGIVAGIQGDLGWANEKGSSGPTGMTIGPVHHATLDDTITWTGSLTGRVGATMGGAMLYGLAGIAAAGNSLTNSGDDGLGGATPVEANVTNTNFGFTVGAGAAALSGPFEAFVEYRFTNYGNADYAAAVGPHKVDLLDQSVRAGLNYHMY